MYVLGIAPLTESAAVLVRDGRVVAAAEEERFSRVKHQGGFPFRALRWVLEAEGIGIGDVAGVGVAWNPWRVGRWAAYLLETLVRDPALFVDKARRAARVWSGGQAPGADGWGSLLRLRGRFRRHAGSAPRRLHYLDHHACHMASCFLASPFPEAAVLVMDGAGEHACTTTAVGRGTSLRVLRQHPVPHSLGHFYSAVTGYLGLGMLDGEYRTMGLAPYGDPAGAAWIRARWLVSRGPGEYRLRPGVLDYHRALRGDFSGAFAERFGPPRPRGEGAPFDDRHAGVAASAQRAFEEVVLDLAADLRRATGLERLVVAGGCGLNCVANGRILGEGVFGEVHVPPVPHDAGGALGAALLLHARLTGRGPEPLAHAALGPAFGAAAVEEAVRRGPPVRVEPLAPGEAPRRAAGAIAGGAVLAWVDGAMEFGPRALGQRSFLASPLSDGIRGVMNEKIKKRELFRPFAPSVKAERAADYFHLEQPSPYMSLVVPVRPEKRATIPAVTHVDGTARPQTVDRATHPRYWALLDELERLTGVPVVLNTSFNIQEPIVCTPDEALATFARSGADALVLGDHWVTRPG
jgi:carbamoyltransferase